MQLQSADGSRPPEYFFTDSNGRFAISRLIAFTNYIVTIESDEKNWATTTVRFMPYGRRYGLAIHLEPLAPKPTAPGPSVSVAELSQSVPREARRDFEFAVELLARGENDRARSFIEKAIAAYPDFVDARNELSVVLMKEGNLPAAEAQLRRALAVDATAVRPLLNLGLCLYRQQKFADALPFLEKAVQLQSYSSNGHFLIGMSYYRLQDDKHAEPAFLKAYELGGKSMARAQYYLARLYTRNKNYSRAATALETYLRDNPDAPDAAELQATLVRLRSPQSK